MCCNVLDTPNTFRKGDTHTKMWNTLVKANVPKRKYVNYLNIKQKTDENLPKHEITNLKKLGNFLLQNKHSLQYTLYTCV